MIQTNGKKVFNQIKLKAEALFVTCEYWMQYVTGFGPENGAVLVDKNGVTLFTDSRYIEAAEKLFAGTVVPEPSIERSRAPQVVLEVIATLSSDLKNNVHMPNTAAPSSISNITASTILFAVFLFFF